MIRLLAVFAGLTVCAPAFACAGGKCSEECGKAHEQAAIPADVQGTHVLLNVTGMSCVSCSNKVTASLKAVEGVKSATVDVATGKAELVIDNKKTNADALAKVVTDSGFKTTVSTQ